MLSGGGYCVWMLEILRTYDIATPDDLDRTLGGVDMAAVSEAMRHQFPAGHVRRLDDDRPRHVR